jgi:GNAT superfamily N-acetyltransferase
MTPLDDLAPEALHRAIEANFANYSVACAQIAGGEVHESEDVTWVSCRFDLGYYNGVLRTRWPEGTDCASAVRERLDWFQQHQRRMIWWVTPFTRPSSLAAILAEAGLTFAWRDVGMAVDLRSMPADLPKIPDVRIEPVTDQATMREWTETMGKGFEMPPERALEYSQMLQSVPIERHPFGPFFLARLHGEPVGTSALFVTAGVAGINEISVVPSARHRGIGALVTLAAMQAGRARGLRVGVLTASPMGERVYRRLGFQQLGEYDAYQWHPQIPSEQPK